MATVTTTKSTGVGANNDTGWFGGLADNLLDFTSSVFGNGSLSAPATPKNESVSDNLSVANQYAKNALQDNYSAQISAARAASQIAGDDYAKKGQIDFNNKINEAAFAKNLNTPSYATDATKRNSDGTPLTTLAQWRHERAIQSDQYQGQIRLANANAYNQRQFSLLDYQHQLGLAGSQQATAKELASIEANTKLATAGIGAQGSILSSLFGSAGSGTPNYRYWS